MSTYPTATKESTEIKTVCDIDYKIHFVQLVENNKTIVRAVVTNKETNKPLFSVSNPGTFASLIADQGGVINPSKTIYNRTIVNKLRADYCSSPVVDSNEDSYRDSNEDSRAEIIARGLKNCTLDKAGRALKRSEVYQCNLGRLQSITLDQDDEDSEDARSPRRTSRSGLAKVESILRPLKSSIKQLLLSSKEEKQEEGMDRLEDVVSALEDIRETADGKDARAIDKMIVGLRRGFVLGAKVVADADEYQSKFDMLSDKIAELQAQQAQVPVAQQYAYNNALLSLSIQRQELGNQMGMNSHYTGLRALSQSKAIETSDYMDFTSTYNQLLAQIRGTGADQNQATSTTPVSPELLNQRSTYANPYGSNAGAPNVNYQALGLPVPSNPTYAAPATQPSTFNQPGFNQPGFNQPGFNTQQPYTNNGFAQNGNYAQPGVNVQPWNQQQQGFDQSYGQRQF